jgi:hypothetical protein
MRGRSSDIVIKDINGAKVINRFLNHFNHRAIVCDVAFNEQCVLTSVDLGRSSACAQASGQGQYNGPHAMRHGFSPKSNSIKVRHQFVKVVVDMVAEVVAGVVEVDSQVVAPANPTVVPEVTEVASSMKKRTPAVRTFYNPTPTEPQLLKKRRA